MSEWILRDKQPAVTYRLRGANLGGWANITIREWTGGGSVDCQSDFGNFSYSWSAIGSVTFRWFLRTIDYSYFMGKAHPKNGTMFDLDKTISRIKSDIIEARKDFRISAVEARQMWNDAADLDACDESGFYREALEGCADTLGVLYDFCPHYVPVGHSDDPQCRAFWDGPWRAVCEIWRREEE